MKAHIVFSTNNLPGSILIRVATWSSFSHCDLLLENGNVIGATALHGVIEYPFEERIADSRHWAICEVDIESADVETQARKYLGKAYDWLGCLGIGMHRDWQGGDKWFCSELIAKAFLDAGKPLLNPMVRSNRVTPQMLLTSPLLEVVATSDFAV